MTTAEAYGYRYRELAYAVPGVAHVRRRRTAVGGVLDDLGLISNRLAETYEWQAAQATTFVLTGIAPAWASMTGAIRNPPGALLGLC